MLPEGMSNSSVPLSDGVKSMAKAGTVSRAARTGVSNSDLNMGVSFWAALEQAPPECNLNGLTRAFRSLGRGL